MRALFLFVLSAGFALAVDLIPETSGDFEYQVIATSKTSTFEQELNAAGQQGFLLVDMKGGETLGGNEVVAVVERPVGGGDLPQYEYRLLATSKTSTMQKELTEAGEAGFMYLAQAVSATAFGGQEVLVVLGREASEAPRTLEYRLLATKRTKTMGRELGETASDGFRVVGVTVSKTAFAGQELVSILVRERRAD